MTIREFLLKHLTDNGLFDTQAESVLGELSKEQGMTDMGHRWHDDIEGYPKPMKAVLILRANSTTVEWIDKNIPLHWARPMFSGEAVPST